MANDYFLRTKVIFATDFGFSRKFSRATNDLIKRNLAQITDHEKHLTDEDCEKDSKGYDRTIKVPETTFGARFRRFRYKRFAEFTMDKKEWETETHPDYYVFGYSDSAEKELAFYMLWNQREFIKLAKTDKIKHGIEKNETHSSVPFLTFKLKDIFDQCHILEFGGSPEAIREILGDDPHKESKLGEYL